MKIWRLCLACFLILFAVISVTNLRFQFHDFLLGILALVSGVLLLVDR